MVEWAVKPNSLSAWFEESLRSPRENGEKFVVGCCFR